MSEEKPVKPETEDPKKVVEAAKSTESTDTEELTDEQLESVAGGVLGNTTGPRGTIIWE